MLLCCFCLNVLFFRRTNSTWLSVSVDGGESWRRAVFDDPVTFGQDERDVWFFFQVFAIGDGAIGVMRINANDIKLGAELFIASVELVRVFFFGGYERRFFSHHFVSYVANWNPAIFFSTSFARCANCRFSTSL